VARRPARCLRETRLLLLRFEVTRIYRERVQLRVSGGTTPRPMTAFIADVTGPGYPRPLNVQRRCSR
jgi:hypothetical protein